MASEIPRLGEPAEPFVAKELLAPLGLMTANFAMLEFQIATGIAELIEGRPQRIGMIVTADLSFRQLVNIFHALLLLRARADSERNSVGELHRRLLKAAEDRNVLTHSLWGLGREQGQSTRLKATIKKGHWKLTKEQVSADEVSKIALEFGRLTGDVFDHVFFLKMSSADKKEMMDALNNPEVE